MIRNVGCGTIAMPYILWLKIEGKSGITKT